MIITGCYILGCILSETVSVNLLTVLAMISIDMMIAGSIGK